MENLQIISFHVDFSTLDIERGEITVNPSGGTCTIRPMIIPAFRLEGILMAEEDDTKGARFTKADFERDLRKVSRKVKNN